MLSVWNVLKIHEKKIEVDLVELIEVIKVIKYIIVKN